MPSAGLSEREAHWLHRCGMCPEAASTITGAGRACLVTKSHKVLPCP